MILIYTVRVSVEWTLGKTVALWKLIDQPKQMRVLLSPVAKMVEVAALFTNLHTCYYGIVSQYFQCAPPSARVYLNQ